MLTNQAIEEVKRYMGFRQDGDSDILNWLQLGQDYLEKSWPSDILPWFLVSERLSTSTAGNEERVALPTGFIREMEEDAIWIVDENDGEHPLRKYDADDLRAYQQKRSGYNTYENVPTFPTSYARTGHYFRLFPKPTQVHTLKIMGYMQDTPPAIDEENLWMKYAPYILIGWAGEKFAAAARDPNALALFGQMKTSNIANLDMQTMSNQMANRRMAMGETA